MRNFLIKVQYDGTRYSGWQRQQNTGNTIENKISSCLSVLNNDSLVEIHGSGRTDAGVHAHEQCANFRLDTDKEPEYILDYLNKYLPEDIRIICVEEVDGRFHARLSATGKTYIYTIDNNKKADVFLRKYAWHIESKLDVDKMIECGNAFVGEKDFITFSDAKNNKKSTIRSIKSVTITEKNGIIKIEYSGNGFLYHMVRKLTAAIVLSGEGKLDITDIDKLLTEKNRQAFKELAPAKGLALKEVYYD